jgi:hypothetical protein
MADARQLRGSPSQLRDLAEFLRSTYPVYDTLGPATRDQRQSINDAADVLDLLAAEAA